MKEKFIIIYRYHKDFELVLERVKLIKHIDPEISVYGIYGGTSERFPEANKKLKLVFEDNYLIKVEDGIWKWLHADITYQMWYNDVGKAIDFDYVAVLEWDLLFMEKIKNLFPNPSSDTLNMSGIIPMEKVSKFWFWSRPENQAKYHTFKRKVEKHYDIQIQDYAMLGPGLCMPKSFLESMSKSVLFEAEVTDELKMPVWAQVFGFNFESNHFYRTWFSFFEQHFFNANIVDVRPETVQQQMKKRDGRRAFHPYRENTEAKELAKQYDEAILQNGHFINNRPYKVKSIHPALYKLHCKLSDLKFGTEKT